MKLLDGPKTPSWLQQIQWVLNSVDYIETTAKHYGDIFITSALDSKDSVFVSKPEALQYIFTNENKDFSAPGKEKIHLAPLIGNSSLTVLEGESHRRRRRLLMPPFHGARMRTYGELICNITEKVINQQAIGKSFSAHSVMDDISLKVLLEAVCGFDKGERRKKISQLIPAPLNNFRAPLIAASLQFPFLRKDLGSWSPWGYFIRIFQQIDELVYDEINERRQQPDPERTDILSLLMAARDEAGEAMTELELRDQLMNLLVAGHATTANVMTWLLYWVHKKPEVRNKLLKELEDLGESPDPITISQLPYLTAVCNETLRIYPIDILTSPRITKSSLELTGYHLNPGTVVYGCIYQLHQRDDLYPEPKQFKPERFLERKFSPYEFMPFGAGVRTCIGKAFAMWEMKLVLATILSRYEITLADDKPARSQPPGTTLAPPVKIVLRGKRASRTARSNQVLLNNK